MDVFMRHLQAELEATASIADAVEREQRRRQLEASLQEAMRFLAAYSERVRLGLTRPRPYVLNNAPSNPRSVKPCPRWRLASVRRAVPCSILSWISAQPVARGDHSSSSQRAKVSWTIGSSSPTG